MTDPTGNSLAQVLQDLLDMEPMIVGGKRVTMNTPDEDLSKTQRGELVKYAVNRLREVWK